MMKINTVAFPETSVLFPDRLVYDYHDSFRADFPDIENTTISQLVNTFFSGTPRWIKNLFILRNALVKLIGLKVPENNSAPVMTSNIEYQVGDALGFFKIIHMTQNECILGEDDKHLDFRISILKEKGTLTVTTTVQYHNIWGRLYFIPVSVFHKKIVPAMLRNTVREKQ
ncbi:MULTISPECIES: DUF2867 domain-containing protein [Chryseobacterium]|uniref:DUF2867 domain-containing protein n=1 Tax=Chryseobacterium camelliae TaxID=1265445 RepID=A0ABU0TI02_9FLAO|nr:MULTISPECIES: DUF2867 domain-containing protein [Chryseobacterium]MDT3409449.1 hypothetical protein [Pseudacidovorax intermedius]MDQ1096686.1 hypothetical protein [Chryseobacterium camelliae]MDQ1100630.1 hypothetical protein [Chryseobacterium sp. SORGH_AS_1048]MDR6087968.1 hypothetical protein [Chryseobacterium sp. SORGH_AS_0909]MDR6132342.1 hypothetical protein [Chryseobacterium sp. SORGH_AS_1175]